MGQKERGEEIRQKILENVTDHPDDLPQFIAKTFSITVQAVYRHIKILEAENSLKTTGQKKAKRYFLGDLRKHSALFPLDKNLSEDRLWSEHFSFIVEGLPENIIDICHYGFTEMVNNAIDHSQGNILYISIARDKENILMFVIDNGEGIFRKIKRECNLHDERQALFELSKGKLTTDPNNHTGEGIFFTSRAFDTFEIESKGIKFSHDDDLKFDYILEIDSDSFSKEKIGTSILMFLKRNTKRDIQSIFNDYAGPDAFQFNKTVIPVKLAQYGTEKLISRSQAKRLLARVERFEHVVFDFDGVSMVGQAFADEIFRVYAAHHPHIQLLPINMEKPVEQMVRRAQAALTQ